ncbi:MAG: HAD family hydrolase [Deltaproteobacteria bacterium]|nr:HAD family hydrolase [Deltaproteobacteria bacterium]
MSVGHSNCLALFDFDGTITNRDTYSTFIKKITPKWRLFIAMPVLFPFILLYKKGLISGVFLRSKISKFAFFYVRESFVLEQAFQYVENDIPDYLRDNMMKRIAWHKISGHRIIVVSASIDPYMNLWAQKHGLEIICTELERCGKFLTGRYISRDCSGKEKVRRIKEKLNLNDFHKIYAYGDSSEDSEMLSLADEAFYQGVAFNIT